MLAILTGSIDDVCCGVAVATGEEITNVSVEPSVLTGGCTVTTEISRVLVASGMGVLATVEVDVSITVGSVTVAGSLSVVIWPGLLKSS